MCPAWMSRQLEPWGTVGTHFCQSSQCLGLTDCTCACVCSSGCLLCAWGGAGLAQKEWMGGPGAAAVGRDCGSRMSQAPCWETERHCHILQNFPYFGCASHQGSLSRAVLCLCPASGYQGAAVGAEHLLTPADICQGLSVCGQEPSQGFAVRVFLCSFLSAEAAVHVQGARSRPDLGPRGQILPPTLARQGHRPHGLREERSVAPARPPLPRGDISGSVVRPSLSLC